VRRLNEPGPDEPLPDAIDDHLCKPEILRRRDERGQAFARIPPELSLVPTPAGG
jgi:hypothetical protein